MLTGFFELTVATVSLKRYVLRQFNAVLLTRNKGKFEHSKKKKIVVQPNIIVFPKFRYNLLTIISDTGFLC